ncbi:hypothetical protein DAETH_41220 (plasmid) [Deinococcus aetherius]|uniref:FAS1 domain-containing protein n=1 Tax=Deinococcus aetherius TaxID=200252 RepID=A0ABN6RQN2_9DEIO|nr:fasciclin domain-containing protein [Deinococcus aetherius]BDP44153.1 hypothetical protein DAETH_41220 [Deinococcus aetherius]
MNSILRALSLSLALGGAQVALAGGGAAPVACQPLGVLLTNNPQLSRFQEALRTSGLITVVNGPAVYTLFAPTNNAFARVPAGRQQLLRNDRVALSRLLSYHIVKGRVNLQELDVIRTPTTLAGVPLDVRPLGSHVVVNNAHAGDQALRACNGLIYVIDTVLLPGDLTPP